MYQKLKQLKNIFFITILVNSFFGLALFLFQNLIIFVLLLVIDLVLVYRFMNDNIKLEQKILDSKELLSSFINKTIDINEQSLLLYDEDSHIITWENEYFKKNFGFHINENIDTIFNGFLFNDKVKYLIIDDHYYEAIIKAGIILFKDVTNIVTIKKEYEDDRECLFLIKLDSIEDVSATVDEIDFQEAINNVRKIIAQYTNDIDGILRSTKNDSYILMIRKKDYVMFIDRVKEMLVEIKSSTADLDGRISLSMGSSIGFRNLSELEFEAGQALDIALARGGNQLVVKEKGQDYKFFGGASESQEKRSRVRVRVVANTLVKLVKQASNVIIMPHTNADLDAIGASLGMMKFVTINNKKAYICADYNNLEQSTADALDTLDINNEVTFYNEEQIMKLVDDDSLLIIVDTSNTEIIESFKVYSAINNRVVIDHHRRANNFITNPLLVHIETYASSSVELVTELLLFQTKSFKLNADVATLMMAGMMVDTDYFTVRTGVRTFEAATILRNKGASPLQAKELLQVSRDTYSKRIAMVSKAVYINDSIALSYYDEQPVTRALLAQAAVELLDVKDVKASFMLGVIEDGSIAISARSNNDYNVQIIIEKFNGGGHFSMAAAQIKNSDIISVRNELEQYILESLKGND